MFKNFSFLLSVLLETLPTVSLSTGIPSGLVFIAKVIFTLNKAIFNLLFFPEACHFVSEIFKQIYVALSATVLFSEYFLDVS